MNDQTHEITAVRYGTVALPATAAYHRHGEYAEPDAMVAMDYYFWIVRHGAEYILLDTGFETGDGASRGRTPLIGIVEALARLGIPARSVTCVVVSHAHYDHIGNLDRFPEATIVIQQRELDFWESPVATRKLMASVTSVRGITELQRARADGRLLPIDGDRAILPGLSVVLLPGHTPGSQGLLVATDTGDILLASDATHFYRELREDRPFAIFTDLSDAYRTLERLREAEARGARVIAGHDPADMVTFPPVPGLEGIAVRIEGNAHVER